MKKVNLSAFLLALLVVVSFSAVGVSIAFRSFVSIVIFTILGFVIMGYGIYLKKKIDT